jgi:hypothetical protein
MLRRIFDFFCVGRLEKLKNLESIWSAIRKLRPEARFTVIGGATEAEVSRPQLLGIDHMSQVSEQVKRGLYSRAKIFLFPSSREGFGIALAEAVQAGLCAVVWKLPVFEELYSDSIMLRQGMIRMIECEDPELFASEAVKALGFIEMRNNAVVALSSQGKASVTASSLLLEEQSRIPTWNSVSNKVIAALAELKP